MISISPRIVGPYNLRRVVERYVKANAHSKCLPFRRAIANYRQINGYGFKEEIKIQDYKKLCNTFYYLPLILHKEYCTNSIRFTMQLIAKKLPIHIVSWQYLYNLIEHISENMREKEG